MKRKMTNWKHLTILTILTTTQTTTTQMTRQMKNLKKNLKMPNLILTTSLKMLKNFQRN
jgi:hypothetical protein